MYTIEFSYDKLLEKFPISISNWYNQPITFNELLNINILDLDVKNRINDIANKLRDQSYIFTTNDNENIGYFIFNKILILGSGDSRITVGMEYLLAA